jgi:hypothetical protein
MFKIKNLQIFPVHQRELRVGYIQNLNSFGNFCFNLLARAQKTTRLFSLTRKRGTTYRLISQPGCLVRDRLGKRLCPPKQNKGGDAMEKNRIVMGGRAICTWKTDSMIPNKNKGDAGASETIKTPRHV